MSSKGAEIRKKLRQITDSHESENVEYAIGQVLEINTDPTDALYNTCKVRILSNKGLYVTDDNPLRFDNKDFNDNVITPAQKINIQEQYSNGLILENVAMSVNGSDNQSINYPVINSEVIVFTSRFQQPFIAQYSDIQWGKSVYNDAISYHGQTIDGANGFAWNILGDSDIFFQFIPWSEDETKGLFEVNCNEIQLASSTSSNAPLFQINDSGVGIKCNNGSVFISNSGQIQIESGQPILIKGSLISIKNDANNMNALLQNMLTLMTTLSNSGGPCVPTDTTLPLTIASQINSLLGT